MDYRNKLPGMFLSEFFLHDPEVDERSSTRVDITFCSALMSAGQMARIWKTQFRSSRASQHVLHLPPIVSKSANVIVA